MNPEIVGKVDSSFLFSYKKELDEAFRNYLEVINPFIVQFEVLRNEFPIELQNEIRAIYGHLARASIAETPQIAAKMSRRLNLTLNELYWIVISIAVLFSLTITITFLSVIRMLISLI